MAFTAKLNGLMVSLLKLDVISKLRCDADLRYVYTGVQKPRGQASCVWRQNLVTDVSRMSLVLA
jgi:hypothetical protein